jgi:hypothetical protein
VQPGTTYYYMTTAVDALVNGNESAYSNTTLAMILVPRASYGSNRGRRGL